MLSRFEQFSLAVSSIYRYIQKIEREEMEKHGLKGAYAQFLVTIAHYPEGVTAAQLCELCELNKAAVSRYVSEMEQGDLVERICTGDTAYRAKLRLTPNGQEIADFVSRRAKQAVLAAGGDLSDEERTMLYDVLGRISKKLQILSINGFPDEMI